MRTIQPVSIENLLVIFVWCSEWLISSTPRQRRYVASRIDIRAKDAFQDALHPSTKHQQSRDHPSELLLVGKIGETNAQEQARKDAIKDIKAAIINTIVKGPHANDLSIAWPKACTRDTRKAMAKAAAVEVEAGELLARGPPQ